LLLDVGGGKGSTGGGSTVVSTTGGGSIARGGTGGTMSVGCGSGISARLAPQPLAPKARTRSRTKRRIECVTGCSFLSNCAPRSGRRCFSTI
jgi:hypothetical protein